MDIIAYLVIYLSIALYSWSIIRSLGDEVSKAAQLEETQAADIVDEPPVEQSQGKPLCITLFANA